MTPVRDDPGSPAPVREALRGAGVSPWRRLPGRNLTKADILVYRLEGAEVAVKDYGARGGIIRNTLGRFLVRRECRAYEAAAGLAGLPKFLGRISPFALALEYVEAQPLALAPQPLDPAVFERLESVVAALHARGIALGDLHHRDVLVGPGATVRIVDLATAWVVPRGAGAFRRAVFRRLAELDRIAVARMRARATGGDVEAAASEAAPSAARWHARGRRLRRLWDRVRGKRGA